MGDGKDRRSYQGGKKFVTEFSEADRRYYRAGRKVWWQDGGKWHTGLIVRCATQDPTGAWFITVMNTDKPTKNVDSGETTKVYPGRVKRL